MQPARALLRFTLVPTAPPLRSAAPTVFGHWLLGRVASLALDWPAVGFHRVELTGRGLEILLLAGPHANCSAQFTTIAHVTARETALAAARQRWVRGPLWSEVEVIEAEERSSAPALRAW